MMNNLSDSVIKELRSKYNRLIPYLLLNDLEEINRRMTLDIKQSSKLGYLLTVRDTKSNEVNTIQGYGILPSNLSILDYFCSVLGNIEKDRYIVESVEDVIVTHICNKIHRYKNQLCIIKNNKQIVFNYDTCKDDKPTSTEYKRRFNNYLKWLWVEGYTQEDIAKVFEMSSPAMSYHLKKLGLKNKDGDDK